MPPEGVSHDTNEEELPALKATWTSPGQDHGDPAEPDKIQDGACGRSRARASALAAG